MNVAWAAAGGVAGLVAGAMVRGPVFRLSVARGEADRTACSQCATPLRRWLVIRCGHCGGSVGRPATLELLTAAVLALLLGRFARQPDVVAFAFLGVLGVALSAIDIAVNRLPDRLTLPAIPLLIALLGAAAVINHQGGALVRALLGGLALGGCFLLLALVRPGQLGGGDIKLAVLAGLALAWLGWRTLLAGAALGFVLAGLAGLVLLALRRATLRTQLCFGPFLLAGALIGVLAAGGAPAG
jgi:leader peptidase (prepilin peptidase) / N-methyltransferase